MKIAHITLHYDLKTGIGIINNCRQKSLAFKEVGIHDVDVILLNYSSNQFDKDIVFINAKDKNIFQSSKNRLFNKYNLINNSINMTK